MHPYHLPEQIPAFSATATKCWVPVVHLAGSISSVPPIVVAPRRLQDECLSMMLVSAKLWNDFVTCFCPEPRRVEWAQTGRCLWFLISLFGTAWAGKASVSQISKCLLLWASLDDKMLMFQQSNPFPILKFLPAKWWNLKFCPLSFLSKSVKIQNIKP